MKLIDRSIISMAVALALLFGLFSYVGAFPFGTTPGGVGLVATTSITIIPDPTTPTIGHYIGIASSTPSERFTISGGSLFHGGQLNPMVVGGEEVEPGTPAKNTSNISVSGKYVYQTFEHDDDASDAIRIIDASDPSNPFIAGGEVITGNSIPTSASGCGNCKAAGTVISGKYLYVIFQGGGSSDRLRIIDVSNPANLVVLGGANVGTLPPGLNWGIAKSGNYLFVSFSNEDDALRVFDVSDPHNPVIVAGNSLPGVSGGHCVEDGGRPRQIFISGDYLYMAIDRQAPDFQLQQLAIVDISDPTNPQCVFDSSMDPAEMPNTNARTIYVQGRYAYMGFQNFIGGSIDTTAAVRIVDISNPKNPVVKGGDNIEGHIPTDGSPCGAGTGEARTVYVAGRYLFVTFNACLENSLRILDVQDPENLKVVGGQGLNFASGMPASPSTTAAAAQTFGRYTYLTFLNQGVQSEALRIIDINGIETAALNAHTTEVGNLNVLKDIKVGNNAAIRGGVTIGGYTHFSKDVGILGEVSILGSLQGPNKMFKIDHPLFPKDKILRHNVIESSERKNIYTGTATIDKNGEITIKFPDYFQTLNKEFRYQLTATSRTKVPLYLKQEMANNTLIIGGEPGTQVSWQVTGVRHDTYAKEHPLRIEELKTQPGYLHPELFDD
jgi:hypothetical protein